VADFHKGQKDVEKYTSSGRLEMKAWMLRVENLTPRIVFLSLYGMQTPYKFLLFFVAVMTIEQN
jgi:hypothetical protein